MKTFICHPDNRRPLDDSPYAGDAVALLSLMRCMKQRGLGDWTFTFSRADSNAVGALYLAGLVAITCDPADESATAAASLLTPSEQSR